MKTSTGSEEQPAHEPLLRKVTRRLRDWLNVVLEESREKVARVAPQADSDLAAAIDNHRLSERSDYDNMRSAAMRRLFGSSGPPEEWLKLVREGAPELLLPEEAGGTSWSGLGSFSPEPSQSNNWIPVPEKAPPSPMLSREDSVQAYESATQIHPEAKPSPKLTLIQSLESLVADVFRFRMHGNKHNDQKAQAVVQPYASTIRARRESDSSAQTNSSMLHLRSRQTDYAGENERGRSSERPLALPTSINSPIRRPRRPDSAPNIKSSLPDEQPAHCLTEQTANPLVHRDCSSVASPGSTRQPENTDPRVVRRSETQRLSRGNNLPQSNRERVADVPPFGLEPLPRPSHSAPIQNARPEVPAIALQRLAAKTVGSKSSSEQGFAELPQVRTTDDVTRVDDRWAELPDTPSPPSMSWLDSLRQIERVRALDLEQRGGK